MSKLGDLIYSLLSGITGGSQGGAHERQAMMDHAERERERRNADEAMRGQAVLEQRRVEAERLHARAKRSDRMHRQFKAEHAQIMQQPVVIPDSTPASTCKSSSGSCSSAFSCSSCGGGGD